jgi:hypothetical protein
LRFLRLIDPLKSPLWCFDRFISVLIRSALLCVVRFVTIRSSQSAPVIVWIAEYACQLCSCSKNHAIFQFLPVPFVMLFFSIGIFYRER